MKKLEESGLQFLFDEDFWHIFKLEEHTDFKKIYKDIASGVKDTDFMGIYKKNVLCFFEI